MELRDTFTSQLKRTRDAGASQKEREAVVDLLVMTMYADHFINDTENVALERATSAIGNDASLPLSQYLNTSIAKVRRTLGSDAKQRALLKDISSRLGTGKMRTLAYRASRAIARVDGNTADAEEQFLSTVRSVFGVQL